jgi:hypothetical protein
MWKNCSEATWEAQQVRGHWRRHQSSYTGVKIKEKARAYRAQILLAFTSSANI